MESLKIVCIKERLKNLYDKKSNINLRDCYESMWINNLMFSINNEIDMLEEELKRLQIMIY